MQAGVGAIMCSYNRVSGTYACENADELIGTLRDAWNFDGMVMSDWGALHSTVKAARSPGWTWRCPASPTRATPAPIDELFGLVLQQPSSRPPCSPAAVTDADARTAWSRHILTAMFRIGLFDHPTPDPATVQGHRRQHPGAPGAVRPDRRAGHRAAQERRRRAAAVQPAACGRSPSSATPRRTR